MSAPAPHRVEGEVRVDFPDKPGSGDSCFISDSYCHAAACLWHPQSELVGPVRVDSPIKSASDDFIL